MTSDDVSPERSVPGPAAGTWCCEFELSGDARPVGVTDPAGQAQARVLVRLHGETLGYLTVPFGAEGLDTALLSRRAQETYGDRIAGHLTAEGLPVEGSRPPAAGPGCPNHVESAALVSVVVCTRNRSGILVDCLDRLRALTHPHLEVIVVDNAPTDDSTRRVVQAVADVDARFRYVLEPRPGLSCARNRGLEEARGEYLAYTDDDVAVDADWVQGLLRGFQRRADTGCVTGLVCTASITGPAEEYFDARTASWSTRVEPQVFDLRGTGRTDALYPYSPGIFGTGASLAFDRALLLEIGGFDEALGAGTLTRGGEDLDVFIRVLRAGRALVYEPAAVVWHHHRADEAALLAQMYGYGTGLSAFMAKCLLDPATRWEVLRRVPLGLRRIAAIRSQTDARLTDAQSTDAQLTDARPTGTVQRPAGAMRREFTGFLTGPLLYLRARRAVPPRSPGTLEQDRVGVRG
ncbi:glycosyltransferase [Modestobacter sp. VKM Ac-2986]|uniref:glycosyltransferase family 2 protein n=1 Tax=Modestobacter sp. VKM Ac-2986 TaxID=3004140 RepID=UPI0022ABB8FB|nr:glycosyltransferase [Modestobacter sp. VKM Ac-2986]MCZ2829865.1 glycosyltransferase [Modestobacter sp. VKM Ac-2986]